VSATRKAVSVIVPVRNDAAGLQRCLASVREASPPAVAVEVIVVDNGSTDGSAEIARQAGSTVIVKPGERVSALRNAGAAVASGDILAFVDADHELDPGWLRSLLTLFEDPAVSAAGAPYSSPQSPTWVQRAYDALRCHPAERQDVDWLASGNLAIRRSVFESVGGFDRNLEACEDVDLCRRLRARGARLVSDPKLRSIHHGDPQTLRQLFVSELWRGRNNLQVSLRERPTLRSTVSVAIPVFQLTALVASPLVALSKGTPVPLLIGLGAFLAPSAARVAMMRSRAPLPVLNASRFAVVFDSARALALVLRKGHRRAVPQQSEQ
jgi:GT2 family glycosyltransferase